MIHLMRPASLGRSASCALLMASFTSSADICASMGGSEILNAWTLAATNLSSSDKAMLASSSRDGSPQAAGLRHAH